MLKDYPLFKREVSDLLSKIFNQAVKEEFQFFEGIAHSVQHEGNKGSYSTAQGTVKNKAYQQFKVEYIIKNTDVPTMSFEDVAKLVQEKGKEMGSLMSKHFFETVNQATDEAGNVLDHGGKPFDLEAMFQLLEKIEIPFDNDGNAQMPTVVIHPSQTKHVQELIEKEKVEHKYEQKHKDLMEKKRKEWDEEQNSRKLVD